MGRLWGGDIVRALPGRPAGAPWQVGASFPPRRRPTGRLYSGGHRNRCFRRPTLTQSFDVFFSYNSKDRDAVRAVRVALEARGVRVWMDEEALPLGQPWQPHVAKAIGQVRAAAVLVGPSGFGDWQKEEAQLCLTQGVKRGIPVIPVLLHGGPAPDAVPEFLRERTCCDFRDGDESRLDRLAREILESAPEAVATASAVAPRPSRRIQNLPFPPLGDLLKGRDADISALEAHLQAPGKATAITQTQAIHGLGGIGKTRLAVEYAWRSADHYDAVLFVVADSPEALQSGLAGLASLSLHGLARSASRAQAEEVAAVLAWLQNHDRWLLILDNVDSEEAAQAVRSILPRLQGGHILVTSRRRNWPPSVHSQPLGKLDSEEATQFLLQRTEGRRSAAPDDAERARDLQNTLDGLPLALEQAAAYIAHHQMTFAEYLTIWGKEREHVLGWRDKDQDEYSRTLATTWQTTFRQLRTDAAALLRLTAYLAPDPIPVEMFEKGANYVEQAVKLLVEENGQTAEARPLREGLAELGAYSMVTREGATFAVHRMVQEVLRTRIPEERRREWVEFTLRLVDSFAPPEPGDVRTWPIWSFLRPHASQVVQYADAARIAQPTSRLMNDLELYLKSMGLYTESEPLIRRALAIEEALDPESTTVATRLNNLAQLLASTDRLDEAEPLMRRALKIDEGALGPEHPKVAIRLNNLASLLQDTNRLAEAEPLKRRALKIDEDALGPDHPKVAIRLNNLARLLQATDRLAEAEPLMRRALKIDENAFGPDHPDVAIDLNNLALLLQDMDRLAEAELLVHRAVAIFEASLGTEHPRTRGARQNLERLLAELKSGDR